MLHEFYIAPHGFDLSSYFGAWAVEETRFLQSVAAVESLNLKMHISENAETDIAAATSRRIESGDEPAIAVIDINGTMTKRGSSLSGSGSTVRLRQEIRSAARDTSVGAILLRIDSPGGQVAGTADLAAEVRVANKQKPVVAFAEDLTASAAVWVASQAGQFFANDRTALVGSIGTFVGLYDLSGFAENEGIKAIVVKAGEFKGMGFEGTEVTEEQIAVLQEIVDETQAEFNMAVSEGRGVPLNVVANEWALGRVFTAAEAKSMGLIDGIQSFDETVSQLREQITSNEREAMSEQTPQAASYADLKACLPGADSDFICKQLESNATIDQAQSSWMEEQNRRIEAAEKKAKETSVEVPGVDGLQDEKADSADNGNASEAFWASVAAKEKGGMSRQRAVSKTVREDKELHAAMLSEVNAR